MKMSKNDTDPQNSEIVKIVTKKYNFAVDEYITLLNNSTIIQSLPNKRMILKVGLDAITHIFCYKLIKTHNIDVSLINCQKGYYCYLEYIEQIHKNSITEDLDVKDAVLFIYNKTIGNTEDEKIEPNKNTIISLNGSVILDIFGTLKHNTYKQLKLF
jgi:S-ribosylhomocysteine lyase LuxS involved in autoinducer biosynthesis